MVSAKEQFRDYSPLIRQTETIVRALPGGRSNFKASRCKHTSSKVCSVVGSIRASAILALTKIQRDHVRISGLPISTFFNLRLHIVENLSFPLRLDSKPVRIPPAHEGKLMGHVHLGGILTSR